MSDRTEAPTSRWTRAPILGLIVAIPTALGAVFFGATGAFLVSFSLGGTLGVAAIETFDSSSTPPADPEENPHE